MRRYGNRVDEPPRPDTDRPLVVAFIGATGRSGSTLLSKVLDAAPGYCSVGELCWLWNLGLLLDRPCGCGRPFLECPFWTEVGERAFGGWGNVDAARAASLRRRLSATRSLPLLLLPSGRRRADVVEYRELLRRLYTAIGEVSGAVVVVDNSKQVGSVVLARRVPGVDLRLVHLVRRSHGVARSWAKQVARSDLGGGLMRRRSVGRTAAKWTLDNLCFEVIGVTGTPRTLLRYEDFVAEPVASTRRLLEFLGGAGQVPLDFVRPDQVRLGTDHSVWGNPMRSATGWVALRADDKWRTELGRRDRAVVSVVSVAGLLRYRYLARR